MCSGRAATLPETLAKVVDAVEAKLLTPFGLRSLAPDEPDFRPRYFGDLRARDAAYHQGTVRAPLPQSHDPHRARRARRPHAIR